MSGNRARKSVRPSALAQFFDAPPASRNNQTTNSHQPSNNGGFGSANRTALNEQRMLTQVTEDDGLGGAFGRADYQNDVNLPRTEAQRILYRESYEKAEDEMFVMVPEHFTIAGVVPPSNKKLKIPQVKNEFLMTPQQRRELNAFELKKSEAVKLNRTAKADKNNMIQVMRTTYPNGVIGLDQVEPKYGERHPNIYAEKMKHASRKFEKATNAQEARKRNLVAKSDSLQQRGYSFIQQIGNAPPQGAIVARKGAGVPPPKNTHSRLFERETSTFNEGRAQQLWHQDTRGRNFNIVTGAQH